MNFKHIIWCGIVLFGVLLISSCDGPPDLPEEPTIVFSSIDYQEGPGAQDTLILTITFEDGDGNLGLNEGQIGRPFHAFDFIFDSNGIPVTYRAMDESQDAPFELFIPDLQSGTLLESFGNSSEIPPLTFNTNTAVLNNTRDWFFPPVVIGNDTITVTDTLRIQTNENFNNIFVRFFAKQADGSFVEIDLIRTFGFNFDGRFPVLNLRDNDRPIEGELTYRMLSAFQVAPIFANNVLKLEVQVQDRSLNRSNIIETEEFTIVEPD